MITDGGGDNSPPPGKLIIWDGSVLRLFFQPKKMRMFVKVHPKVGEHYFLIDFYVRHMMMEVVNTEERIWISERKEKSIYQKWDSWAT